MSLKRFLAEGSIRPRRFAGSQIGELVNIADRDLADAAVEQLSADRRFLIAYDAVLKLATIPLNCEGYETSGPGAHRVTFQLLPELTNEQFTELANYFESCRTKRNVGTYDRSGQISATDADELLLEAKTFKELIEGWMSDHCSQAKAAEQ